MLFPQLFRRSIQHLRRNTSHAQWSVLISSQFFSDKSDEKPPPMGKYVEFKDSDSEIILDIEEERSRIRQFKESEEIRKEEILKRGTTGVFDIHVLVDMLKENKAEDIFVAKIPPELRYVDYLVVATGKSRRHINGLGETIRKMYKRIRHDRDLIPTLEGEKSDWMALDLGNIALHIMSNDARELYDLESLWGIGSKYDLKLNSPDTELIEMLKNHNISLDDIQPSQRAQ